MLFAAPALPWEHQLVCSSSFVQLISAFPEAGENEAGDIKLFILKVRSG